MQGFVEKFNIQNFSGWISLPEEEIEHVYYSINNEEPNRLPMTIGFRKDLDDSKIRHYIFDLNDFNIFLNKPLKITIFWRDKKILGTPINIETRETELAKVLVGKDGWLFLDNDTNEHLSYIYGKKEINSSFVTKWQQETLIRKLKCQELGIKMLSLVVPEKTYLYSDFLPNIPQTNSNVIPVFKETSLLSEYIIPEFKHEISNFPKRELYYKGDTHWNYYGAYHAYLDILDGFNLLEESISFYDNFKIRHGFMKGDLISKLNAANVEMVEHVSSINTKFKLTKSNELLTTGRIQQYENENSINNSEVLIFHTSSIDWMKPYILNHFKKVTLVWSKNFDWKLIEEINPELILFQTNERFLYTPPKLSDKQYLSKYKGSFINTLELSLFQNIGVWGLDGTPLSIDFKKEVQRLEIFLTHKEKECLNIKKIEVIDCLGNILNFTDIVSSATISENFFQDEGKDILPRLISKQMLHSKAEVNPKITICFKDNLFIDHIRIYNRVDKCGLRSKTIAVNAYIGDEKVVQFQNISDEEKILTTELKNIIDIDSIENLPSNLNYAAKYIRKLLYLSLLNGEKLTDKLKNAILPTYDTTPKLDSYSAEIITNYIQNRLKDKSQFSTRDLLQFKNILNDDVSIEVLADYSSKRISQKLNSEKKVVISKHTVHYDNLITYKDSHLIFMEKLFSDLLKLEGIPMLAYGTLLGAYRDFGFLEADDDIDLIYFYENATNREETINGLISQLKTMGYFVGKQRNCPHITVTSRNKSCNIGVDIFIAWGDVDSNLTDVVMERLEYRTIPTDILIPTSEISLYGKRFQAPAKIENFLEERYGKGWVRKNPYYDWPWLVERRLYSNNQELNASYDYRENTRSKRHALGRTPRMVAWSQCVDKKDRPLNNSIPMLNQALDHSYDVIELILRSTSDNEILLALYDTVKTLSGEKVTLSNSTWNELKDLDIGIYKGEKQKFTHVNQALSLLTGKKILLDGLLLSKSYKKLKEIIINTNFEQSDLLFCVYNEEQLRELIMHFPDSIFLWKFYCQAWEIDALTLDQLRKYGVDGVMFAYPHYNEEHIRKAIYEIKVRGLQSLAFIHGQKWTHPHSTGLSPDGNKRALDDYDQSLIFMTSLGIEYITTTECQSAIFKEIIRYK